MDGRRRTARSLANDVVVRQAVVEEILAAGVDRVGPTAVARRAGFTTGAVYGRYENSAEMLVDVWLELLWPRLRELLVTVVAEVVDGGTNPSGRTGSGSGDVVALDVTLAEASAPPQWLRAATEVLAVARRSEELHEVLAPQVTELLDQLGAGPEAPPQRRALVLLAIGYVLGTAVNDLAGLPTGVGDPILEWARRAGVTIVPALPPADHLEVSEWVVATGDPVRDRLLRACIEVIADVGFERATISRIVRRADVGTNWVYSDHDSKLELLVEAIDVLVDALVTPAAVEDLARGRRQQTPMGAVALALAAYLHEVRATERLARLEALLTARHYPGVGEVLADMWQALFASHVAAAGVVDPLLAEASQPVLYYLAAQLSGLAVLDSLVGPLDGVDWRYGLLPFETVILAALGDDPV